MFFLPSTKDSPQLTRFPTFLEYIYIYVYMCVCVCLNIHLHIYVLSTTFEKSLGEKRMRETSANSVGEKPMGEKPLVMTKHKRFL